MTGKQLKFYQLLKSILTLNVFTDYKKLLDLMEEAIKLDYNSAVEIWEFLILDNEGSLPRDAVLADVLCDRIGGVFYATARAKYIKTLIEVPAVCRAAYQYAPGCFSSFDLVSVLAGYLVSAKEEAAADILSCASKNTACKISFGDFMRTVLEKVYVEILKKSSDGKIRLNKKIYALLFDYIGKLKGADKALLTQRLKETL